MSTLLALTHELEVACFYEDNAAGLEAARADLLELTQKHRRESLLRCFPRTAEGEDMGAYITRVAAGEFSDFKPIVKAIFRHGAVEADDKWALEGEV